MASSLTSLASIAWIVLSAAHVTAESVSQQALTVSLKLKSERREGRTVVLGRLIIKNRSDGEISVQHPQNRPAFKEAGSPPARRSSARRTSW